MAFYPLLQEKRQNLTDLTVTTASGSPENHDHGRGALPFQHGDEAVPYPQVCVRPSSSQLVNNCSEPPKDPRDAVEPLPGRRDRRAVHYPSKVVQPFPDYL